MGLKSYKPTSPGIRGKKSLSYKELTSKEPEKSLTIGLKKRGGRNNTGKITVRHHGGGNKVLYRKIDFKRDKENVEGVVKTIEYDPNRSAFISLIYYKDGEKRYILYPQGLQVEDTIISSKAAEIKVGNHLEIGLMPLGTTIHNVELFPSKGATLVRSAGTSAQIIAKEGQFCQLRLPSGEVRKFDVTCRATVGQIGNLDHINIEFGKAGIKRHLGIRPTVRGIAMNPIDHPHGGGEGKSPIGHPGPLTPWSKPTLGYKTRSKKKLSSRYIVKRRK